ncbi:hypothetical protein B0J17DRAFT_574188 [Rhizoctonia solani]|nr:hypothetical protein B0J17DRAFT_574188 [Rhizoctonia solani]
MSIDAVSKPFRGPWEGDTKIVLGIDIGITQSGVAFAFLKNGASQVMQRVTKWPGQEIHSSQPTIPTLVWYDSNKQAVSCGAEAQLYTTEEQAEDNRWVLAKYFKLHLHPSDMQTKHELKLDPLPPGITLQQVYSDFMEYLLKHTRTFFEDRIIDGKSIWEQYSPTMEVVIAHPSGWGVREQSFLRLAAVAAGFSTSGQASNKIRFVTEAEAFVHFYIDRTNLGSILRAGTSFAMCDAGDSTVDTTLYSVISERPVLKFEEKRTSACIQAGAIFVDAAVERFLLKTLEGTELDPDEIADCVNRGMKNFEIFVKWTFRDETTEQTIALAQSRFNHPLIGVRRGRMTLSGSKIKEFFDGCVKHIIASVDEQLDGFDGRHILLIGEFGNSPYLRQVFKKRYEPQGYKVFLVDDYSSAASAVGAVLWNAMSTTYRSRQRTLRSSWGIETSTAFSNDDPDHRDYKSKTSPSGRTIVSGRWYCLVRKVRTTNNLDHRQSKYKTQTPN